MLGGEGIVDVVNEVDVVDLMHMTLFDARAPLLATGKFSTQEPLYWSGLATPLALVTTFGA